jgi:hypothetical protein
MDEQQIGEQHGDERCREAEPAYTHEEESNCPKRELFDSSLGGR